MGEQTYPEPTTGVFIFNAEGKLLLLKSHKWPGKYVIPGGHVELGERIEAAAKREAREETGLEVSDLQFICFQEFVYDPAFWKPRHYIFFDYACRAELERGAPERRGRRLSLGRAAAGLRPADRRLYAPFPAGVPQDKRKIILTCRCEAVFSRRH